MGTSFADATWAERSIFFLFMLLWIIFGLLNQANAIRHISFDATALVWLQEVLKVALSVGLFCLQDGGFSQLLLSAVEHWTMACWYLIPAGLYALTDVLTYINLRTFDPATYHLLGEMKLVLVGVVHQVLFRRRLGLWHWVALGIITAGCVVKTLDSLDDHGEEDIAKDERDGDGREESMPQPKPTLINYVLLFISILASTVAGVYNEKLLKDRAAIPINLQNICLYLDGIAFLTAGMLTGLSDKSIADAFSRSNLRLIYAQPTVLAMAIVMSTAGIATSRFLQIFDSVRKSIAVSLVVVLLPFLSWFFFGTAITFKMVMSVVAVVVGMYLYTWQPPPGSQDRCEAEDELANNILVFESPSLVPQSDESGRYVHLLQREIPDASEEGLAAEDSDIELPSTERDSSLSNEEECAT